MTAVQIHVKSNKLKLLTGAPGGPVGPGTPLKPGGPWKQQLHYDNDDDFVFNIHIVVKGPQVLSILFGSTDSVSLLARTSWESNWSSLPLKWPKKKKSPLRWHHFLSRTCMSINPTVTWGTTVASLHHLPCVREPPEGRLLQLPPVPNKASKNKLIQFQGQR